MSEQQPQDHAAGFHVDAGWKQQAEKEKEELAEKVGDAEPAAGRSSPPSRRPAGAEKKRPLPPVSFELLVQQHVTPILLALGHLPDPAGSRPAADLDRARLYIDLLILLRDKTRGNLTESEERLLAAAVYEMQMAYVEALQKK